jgi:hypothetical protein
MAFDTPTRNRLQRFVNDARRGLEEEFTRQLQNDYGLDPNSGAVTPLDNLRHLNDAQRETARILRDTLAHYRASENADEKTGLDRIVREQAFTVLNRLAALRMAEARGLMIESVGNGYQAKGFQLYARLAGTGLGETGDAYRVYLFSVFDELAQDLPGLFDRYAPQGRLFPREPALLQALALIDDAEIEPLWAEDETIGWIYQYFNSKEERDDLRDASTAPRNSRELAVRNQFFTPRYVVEFLVDNTLGRLWFDATGGRTALRDRCQYLMVKPDEKPAPASRLRDPRTLKLLDPACGSMHFGLYAFDLLSEIYLEAWDWEQQHGPGSLDVSTQPRSELRPLGQTYADFTAFHHDVPRLIVEHNIYGVDIDPRAAQIASLALWLRAQRAWHDNGVKAKDRPLIGRGHVIAATAPPVEPELSQQFQRTLDPLDAQLFEKTLQLLKGMPEMGVLLRVERELPDLILKVYGRVGDMFKEKRAKSWEQIELGLHRALIEFASAARSSYQGRLYAQDALQGLRLIDLTREVFDVIVMNPPFGALSLGVKEELTAAYPESKNDLLGIFVDRGLELLRPGGRLGAITSRTCFFLTSFTDWREKVVLGRSSIEVIADLGQGVMDDAMVEAAAYVLEAGWKSSSAQVIRAIADDNRKGALDECVAAYRTDQPEARLFEGERKTFSLLPDSPFVYWVESDTIRQFGSDKKFEPDVGSVRVGLQTGDDPRFVRAVWEVPPEDTQFCYYPTDGLGFCRFDDPIVLDYFRRRGRGVPRWAFHVKAGASQPWYSPITLKVNWALQGSELRNFTDAKGKLKSRPQNTGFYYRPGFSWTRRAVRMYPYVIPGNCIPSVSRYMAFPEHGMQAEALGVCASRLASAFLRFYGEKFEFPNFLVENLKMLPWPELGDAEKSFFQTLVTREVEARRQAYQNFEPFHEFVLPARVRDYSNGGKALAFDPASLLSETGEQLVASAYGFSPEQAIAVARDFTEAIEYQQRGGSEAESDDEESDDKDFVLDTSPAANEQAHFSYLLGCAFGRWDIRFATGDREPAALADPFAPLPVCPPGMLQCASGLPAQKDDTPAGYPLNIAWSGVLVDDEGHSADVLEHVGSALRLVWGEQADTVELNACKELRVDSLRAYLRRPSAFFADHLKRYSKSARKAPIYWPIGTASGSYTLWLYYPRLSSQTLYTANNDFIEGPRGKLKQVTEEVALLRSKGLTRSREEEKHFEGLQAFELELIELRDTLLEVAPTYKPNNHDGVQINAAPLWQLFRHKPWQKILKETWSKLERGDFDWSHMAMNYWPDRVREKCKTDKSLAIAHGLEHLYVEPEAKPKKSRGRKKAGDAE